MKNLGFGLMRLPLLDPADERSIDLERFKQMADLFLERGFTYFDTAIGYHGFESQRAVKTALVDRHPRNRFALATKLHNDAVIRKCAGMFKIVLGLGALALVMRLFTIFMAAFAAQEATVSFSAFSLLLNVVQFSVYLPLLSAAKKMLAQAV